MSGKVKEVDEQESLATNYITPGAGSVLVCMSPEEVARFCPDGIRESCNSLTGDFLFQNSQTTKDAWSRLLEDEQPEVILGAWSTPPLSADVLKSVPSLRYFCYLCGSVRSKIPRSFIEHGGVVTNWGNEVADTVAECALALIMACARRTTRYTLEMHVEKRWESPGEPFPISLKGLRIGLHGFGNIARSLLPMLRCFTSNIYAYSNGVPTSRLKEYGVSEYTNLSDLFEKSDVVLEVEALTPITRHSVTTRILNKLRPNSIFVNVGRGDVLAPGAIEELAERGDVSIGLDVFSSEPLPASSSLRGNRNVTLLPHTGGPTLDQYPALFQNSINRINRYYQGKLPHNLINVEMFDRMT